MSMGSALLRHGLSARCNKKKLMRSGYCIDAKVFAVLPDWSVRRGLRSVCTYQIALCGKEPGGRQLMFRSEPFLSDPSGAIESLGLERVRVYLNPDMEYEEYYGVFDNTNRNFNEYYVDVGAIRDAMEGKGARAR